MTLDQVKLSLAVGLSVIALGLLAVPARAPAQGSGGGADLAVAVKASQLHVRAHHVVFISLTVTNLGPDTDEGLLVKLITRKGLNHPRGADVPPDYLQSGCPSSSSTTECTAPSRWVPPTCQHSRTELACWYSHLELSPPNGPSSSITLLIKAHAGVRPRESAVASVAGSSDPNLRNNRAVMGLIVRGAPSRGG